VTYFLDQSVDDYNYCSIICCVNLVHGMDRKRKDTVRPFEEQAEIVCILCAFYLSTFKQYVYKMNI